ncbi:MAG: T9SS type A sorting domain-containing protein [Flavobacteriales bacterium]
MKQIVTLSLLVVFTFSANATVHTVTCQNGASHFLPVTVNANVGDTVHWTWISGNHVVGPIAETDIPALADSWYGVIDDTFNDFEYVVNYPGIYYYVCHPNAPHGEDAYIVVADPLAVQAAEPVVNTALYPNPFRDQLTVEITGATSATLYNLLGTQVGSSTFTAGGTTLRMDTGTLPKGIYFCSILRNEAVLDTRRVVKQ